MNQVKVLLERFPYRYVSVGVLENGYPDYRIQKANSTLNVTQTCLLDNQMQLLTAMEDFEYTSGWIPTAFLVTLKTPYHHDRLSKSTRSTQRMRQRRYG